MGRYSGYIVELSDGKAGRTYHKNEIINGKIQVIVLAESVDEMFHGHFLPEDQRKKLLCLPENLKVIGMAD